MEWGNFYSKQASTLDDLLHRAVLDSDLPVLRTLFRASSSSLKLQRLLDAAEFNSFTALQQACKCGNAELVGLLLDQGVNVEARGKDDWTALHVTVWYADKDLTILKLLLNSFADVLARDGHGCLPIDLARNNITKKLLLDEMKKRGASDLAKLYSEIACCDEPYTAYCSRKSNIDSDTSDNESQTSDYLEMDSDDHCDSEYSFDEEPSDSQKDGSLRQWKNNLAVWSSLPLRYTGIKRKSSVSESSMSLISDVSPVKSRDSGVYCDGDDDIDSLAASFQEGKSCLSRWEPYNDLSSFSP